MVPYKLRLRNFMCYRGADNEIDFSGIHLACLTGDNGQGKSALLDAMTWALWGKARTSSADDLITHGESDMEVQLEFELGGARYRVIRQRSAAGRGSSTLELQGRVGNGHFASLSEATIRDSQKRITDLLRLDYDTFVNSAFLLQGRADEFTTKRPAERKQILGDILGLAQYDAYAEEARKRVRAADEQRRLAEHALQQIRETAALIPQYEDEVINAEQRSKSLQVEVRQANELLQKLFGQRTEMDAKAEQLTGVERRAQDERRRVAELEQRLREKHVQQTRYETLMERADAIEDAMARLTQARQEKERWDELFQQLLQLQGRAIQLQGTIDLERQDLLGQLKAVEENSQRLRKEFARYASRERELGEAQARVEQLEALRREREARSQMLKQWSEVRGRCTADNSMLKEKMKELKERMTLLAENEEPQCPVCRRPLSAEGRAAALEDAQREGTSMGDRFRENHSELKQVGQEVTTLEAQIKQDDRQLAEMDRWQRAAADASTAAIERRRIAQELEAATEEAGRLRAMLEAEDYAHEVRALVGQVTSESDSLGYDGGAHDSARQVILSLAPREAEYEELKQGRGELNGLKTLIETLELQLEHHKRRVAADEAEISRLRTELSQKGELLRQIQGQQVQFNMLQRDLTEADRQLGGARQKLEDAERAAAREPEEERRHFEAVDERTIYEQLANAFGKRGVQAMIIDSAIPEIEEEANRLLGRMTDGRMNVALHTQRESKAGDAIETLDIIIADELGERPYETFSGGEAFRVNFSLRIALSKLLTHRAGTSMRTLFMDEGFGSQDAQGRDRLIEAISSVQDDFERILVITHIDEVKDAFPVRIDVVKGSNGSRVMVQ